MVDDPQEAIDGPRTIVRIQAARNQRGRCRVITEGDERLDLSRRSVDDLGLKSGQIVSVGLWHRLERESAYDVAVSLLARSDRTRWELEERLRRRKIPQKAIEATLKRLTNEGLIDDARFARQWVEFRARTAPRGRRLIMMELRQKGVPEDLIEPALSTLDRDREELECARLIEARLPRLAEDADRDRAKRRLLGFLSRRGFSYETIRSALREVAPEWD